MRSSVWAALLRQIPPEQHNILSLVTRGGTDITVQNILRIDEEVLAFKGRLAGSQDAGRLYFIPLDNIDYLGFNRPVKDEEYAEMFGNLQLPPLETPVTLAAAPPPQAEPQAAEVPAEPPPESAPSETMPPLAPSRAGPAPVKSEVLERFRARNTASSNGTTFKPPGE
jgi:hypothetical protein